MTKVEDFKILSTIGSGSYGVVRKILRIKDKQVFVWKELDYSGASPSQKQMLVSEANLLRELRHEHIVRYVDRILDKRQCMLYLIMEFCEGGDLASLISACRREGRKMDDKLVWRVCYQLVLAIKECHSRSKYGKSVLHRDLKPANIFLDSKLNVKLGDFGLARVLRHDTSFAKTCVGTPLYMSPEQMSGLEYNEKSDIWSLGCLLYELCSFRPPFIASNQIELAAKICSGKYEKLPDCFQTSLTSLIYSLLIIQTDKRPGVDDLLQHKGFDSFRGNSNRILKNITNNVKLNNKNNKENVSDINPTPQNQKPPNPIIDPNIHTTKPPTSKDNPPKTTTTQPPSKNALPAHNNPLPTTNKVFTAGIETITKSNHLVSLTKFQKEIKELREELVGLKKEVEDGNDVLKKRIEAVVLREYEVSKKIKIIEERENKCKHLEEFLKQKHSKADILISEYTQIRSEMRKNNNNLIAHSPKNIYTFPKQLPTFIPLHRIHSPKYPKRRTKSTCFFNNPSQKCFQKPLITRIKPEINEFLSKHNQRNNRYNIKCNHNSSINKENCRKIMTPNSYYKIRGIGGKRRRCNVHGAKADNQHIKKKASRYINHDFDFKNGLNCQISNINPSLPFATNILTPPITPPKYLPEFEKKKDNKKIKYKNIHYDSPKNTPTSNCYYGNDKKLNTRDPAKGIPITIKTTQHQAIKRHHKQC